MPGTAIAELRSWRAGMVFAGIAAVLRLDRRGALVYGRPAVMMIQSIRFAVHLRA